MSSTSPPISCTSRLRRATSWADRPKAVGSRSAACTDPTRSARSSASAVSAVSRSARAEATSGEADGVPENPLPFPDCWSNTFQILCGGVHILDFFTSDPGLFPIVVPQDWQPFLADCNPMRLLDILLRDDLDSLADPVPPESMLRYIRDIRRFSLGRNFCPKRKLPKLTRQVSVGMKPKKIHEVSNFANFVDEFSKDVLAETQRDITHFVDFGSGQNYLGRALASSPYNKQIVAVEGRDHNIAGAKKLDIMRNKKLYMQQLDSTLSGDQRDEKTLNKATAALKISEDYVPDFRPQSAGFIRYVSGRLETGDLTDVIEQLEQGSPGQKEEPNDRDLRMMAISIHSCGNLSHHGIRSLILNPHVQAIAIRLGPPTYKHPYMRPKSARRDPHGFPMSEHLATYKGDGIRVNITARMMACQAPDNWTEAESDGFFKRHFFRAVLQKIFLDRGVITKIYHNGHPDEDGADSSRRSPFNMSTNPVIIGSLRKACYKSFKSYVRGAVAKLSTVSEYHEYRDIIREKMVDMTDEEIERYEEVYSPRKREISAIWTLMAFSATVVESLIVTDRWLFLRQHADLVQDCWVETVFDYRESPRNLVIVGIKKPGPRI
ncbi:hypothetical protein F4778DRAFT_771152 [Xylariomycetidae sp. FL2044]|nr:hypothetical protein F4778DRAFT_771152 [Xylariomycetidae sp. FL2044]